LLDKWGAVHIEDSNILEKLNDTQLNLMMDEAENDIKAAKGGDPDASEKVSRTIKEIKGRLHEQEELLAWPKAISEFNSILEYCQQFVEVYGSDEDKKHFEKLKEEAEEAINEQNIEKLEAKKELILSLYFTIQSKREEFWITQFNEIRSDSTIIFTNPQRAKQLLQEGSLAISRRDRETLQSVVQELWQLISDKEKSKYSPSGYESHIKKE